MPKTLSADEIRELLKLEPNQTCGFVRVTYKSALEIAPSGLPAPFADWRPLGSALYFMMTPEEPVKLHRIRNDQLYHYYLGDPIELLLLYESGKSELVKVGPDIAGGQNVQLFIPGGTFHTARLLRRPMVPRRLDRMARRGGGGRRQARRRRNARREIPVCRHRDPHLSRAGDGMSAIA
ncbi:MAG: cupin domain-containing protein [Methyloceanibacter sp.]|uniref:cupin domain-containing protein n=1 Tax=Methyloceanibacter sp. TaxID=1965321 RepID=UPI003D9AC64A